MLTLFELQMKHLPLLLAGVGLAVLVFWAFSRRLCLRRYTLSLKGLRQPVRLLVLSDLHSCRYGKNQCQLVELAGNLAPDFVLFPGDTVDDRLPEEDAFCLLEQLAGRYPCLLVTGNHEYRTHCLPRLGRRMAELGVEVLDNRSFAVPQGIVFHGIADPEGLGEDFAPTLQRLGSQTDPAACNILLAHRPERVEEYLPYGFDLAVCGHTHGGQWRLPGVVEGVFATGQGLFPKYAGGLYRQDGMAMLVSRGLSRRPLLIPRIFNRPEALLVQLLPREEKEWPVCGWPLALRCLPKRNIRPITPKGHEKRHPAGCLF